MPRRLDGEGPLTAAAPARGPPGPRAAGRPPQPPPPGPRPRAAGAAGALGSTPGAGADSARPPGSGRWAPRSRRR
eukprot:3493804-Lingulodinium_polyedra.AAC.1